MSDMPNSPLPSNDKRLPDAVGGEPAEEAKSQYCKHCGNIMPLNATLCPSCGRDQRAQPQTVEQSGFRSYFIKHIKMIRISAFLFCLGIFTLGLFLGSQTPLSEEDAGLILAEMQGILASGGPLSLQIAWNNIVLCLLFFLPVFGVLFMALVSYATGTVISAYALVSASATRSEILLSLFLSPSTWLEFTAYSLAASEGILFLLSVFAKRSRAEGKNLAKAVLSCVAILILSAVIEAALITGASL